MKYDPFQQGANSLIHCGQTECKYPLHSRPVVRPVRSEWVGECVVPIGFFIWTVYLGISSTSSQ